MKPAWHRSDKPLGEKGAHPGMRTSVEKTENGREIENRSGERVSGEGGLPPPNNTTNNTSKRRQTIAPYTAATPPKKEQERWRERDRERESVRGVYPSPPAAEEGGGGEGGRRRKRRLGFEYF